MLNGLFLYFKMSAIWHYHQDACKVNKEFATNVQFPYFIFCCSDEGSISPTREQEEVGSVMNLSGSPVNGDRTTLFKNIHNKPRKKQVYVTVYKNRLVEGKLGRNSFNSCVGLVLGYSLALGYIVLLLLIFLLFPFFFLPFLLSLF